MALDGTSGGTGRGAAIALIAAGVAVFIICSIIQGANGSSMFSSIYVDTGSTIKGLLVNITFWPGWVLTVLLVLSGLVRLKSNTKNAK